MYVCLKKMCDHAMGHKGHPWDRIHFTVLCAALVLCDRMKVGVTKN